MLIAPSIGRVVWYWRNGKSMPQPHAALIAYVHGDRCINIAWFDANGVARNDTSVTLVQEGEAPLEGSSQGYCTWMPYQIGQAKKAG